MKKIILIVAILAPLVFIGCVKTVYIPVPAATATIEPPPPMATPQWVKIDIEGVPYYALPRAEALKLKANVLMSEEYKGRCYELFGDEDQ